MFAKIGNFFKESQQELRQVQWPTRAEAVRLTALVIGLSIVLAAFLGGLDYFFTSLLRTFVAKY